MGEEDKLEPTEGKEVEGENVISKSARKRKKNLYHSIRGLMEFWFSDVNLGKDRFLSQLIYTEPWVDLEIFLRFNKLRALTKDVSEVVKALRKSEILKVSEDGKKVCRVTPFEYKGNVDACTIYVEQIQPDAEHDWLKSVFSEFGPIDYISLPRFKGTKKPKGFAFIEFKNPESANRAIEAFRVKGCCLSPQMDPDKLISIATFEKDEKEQYSNDGGVHEEEENQAEGQQEEITIKNLKKEKSLNTEFESESKEEIKDKKSEPCADDDEIVKDKHKRHKSSDSKSDNTEETTKLDENDAKEKKSIKRKRKSTNDLANEEEEKLDGVVNKSSKRSKPALSIEAENDETTKTKKEKRVSGASLEVEETEATSVEDERVLENGQEIEGEGEENEDGDKKKKRKRKKKHKKSLSSFSFGLQIMPKVEWKRLRNKYLNLQKQKMKQLKQHLRQYQWYDRPPQWQSQNYYEDEPLDKIDTDRSVKEKKKGLEFIPGVIIKVVLDEPVVDVKAIKNQARIHPEVRYVDADEGVKEIYLRIGAPELAEQVLNSKHWSSMELLKDNEEKQYWDKILKDREEKFTKKIRGNQRGRDKLLKKAEKFQGKHIGFDER